MSKERLYGINVKSKEDKTRCVEGIHDNWSHRQCGRPRGHGPNGEYCRQHDPVARKAKDAAKQAAWDAKWNAQRAASELRENSVKAISLAGITPEALAANPYCLAEVVRERDHMNEQAAAFAKRAREMDEENKRLRSALTRAREQRDTVIGLVAARRPSAMELPDIYDAELDAILTEGET